MKTYYFYELYGQRVKSELFLSEAEPLIEMDHYDVLIDLGEPPNWVKTLSKTQCDYLTEDIMWFYLKGLLLFYVEHGNHIRIFKEDPTISNITTSSYLNGSAFSLILMQKKIIPLHGSALSFMKKACIISGPSGSGKSTTALELMKKGFLFMADDIAAISIIDNDSPQLHPGPPWQKVCGNQLTLKEKEQEYLFIDENRDKYARKLTTSYEMRTLPPVALFIILKEDREDLVIKKLQGVEKLHALTHNLYRGEIYHRFGVTPERMQLFLTLAKSMEIYHILRPRNKNTLHDVTDLVFKEFLQL